MASSLIQASSCLTFSCPSQGAYQCGNQGRLVSQYSQTKSAFFTGSLNLKMCQNRDSLPSSCIGVRLAPLKCLSGDKSKSPKPDDGSKSPKAASDSNKKGTLRRDLNFSNYGQLMRACFGEL
jgi:hypothetical protein